MPKINRRSFAPRGLVLAAAISCACCGAAYGQFAPSNAPPVFLVSPTSTMGTVTNNLVLTPLVNGFTVSGQVIVTVPPGPVSGTLAQWTVIRRIDPAFSGSGLMTNTLLTGFSAPPIGTFGTTSGTVVTDWRFSVGSGFVGGSQSSLPMTLVNGVDSPAWTGLFASSGGGGFTWTAGFFPGAVMQQQFTLFGSYTSGPGGSWVIDVPVTSVTVGACNGFVSCDTNCDGSVNPFDINSFLNLMGATPSPCSPCAGDANGDGTANPFDINAFLLCMG